MFYSGKWKYYIFYVVIVVLIIVGINFSIHTVGTKRIDYNVFNKMLAEKQIEQVQVTKSRIIIKPKVKPGETSKSLYTSVMDDKDLINKLEASGAKYNGA